MTLTQYLVAASVDGYIADPEGSLDWLFQFNDTEGLMAHVDAFVAGTGAIAMGAATYEFMLGQGGPWPYPDQRTWVFTHRDLPVAPGTRVELTRDPVEDVHARMVEAAVGRNVWLVGGGDLVGQFAARGLLDELWLGVAPVVLGGGTPLLPHRLAGRLELLAVTHFPDSFLELRYRVPPADGTPPQ
ncbi:dihydrofolate reductase family protein [Cellulomonas cellasea]|uniref:Dihydrofolate reductase n=1 Tax=Cellulomonas cellasea TaxID=43670 RepID=A0A7W4UEC4_9CELL|nr:dihydrofolate reductase family protein [Cellulomonas cellasea]MBB2922115.1 dihydrofolate reductase [Cellulomonas cellasea]